MEPAKINWQTLDSVFVRDDTFENINAPQWVDFSSPHDASSLDDDSWFCKPDCKHPKTAEDFLKSTATSKLLRSVAVSKLIALGDWSRIRDGNLKRRVPLPQDGENQNPNLETPLSKPAAKAGIKSSAEKPRKSEEDEDDCYSEIPLDSDETPKLKSVLSGRDLFAGKDLLGRITDFCTELKKMAIARAKEKERDAECANLDKVNDKKSLLGDRLAKPNDKEIRDRKPFGELSKDSYEAGVRSPLKENPRKKITRGGDDAENIPLSLDLKHTKGKAMGESLQAAIRTSPPTPQCFSGTRELFKSTPSKAPKSRLKERDPFEEIQLKQVLKEEEFGEKSNGISPLPPLSAGREGRTLDVFWFFKPCANSSTEF